MSETRRRVFELLEPGSVDDTASRAVDVFVMVLIVANVGAVMLETV